MPVKYSLKYTREGGSGEDGFIFYFLKDSVVRVAVARWGSVGLHFTSYLVSWCWILDKVMLMQAHGIKSHK